MHITTTKPQRPPSQETDVWHETARCFAEIDQVQSYMSIERLKKIAAASLTVRIPCDCHTPGHRICCAIASPIGQYSSALPAYMEVGETLGLRALGGFAESLCVYLCAPSLRSQQFTNLIDRTTRASRCEGNDALLSHTFNLFRVVGVWESRRQASQSRVRKQQPVPRCGAS